MLWRNKRADYIWISWVLLMAMVIVLSVITMNWIFGYTQSNVDVIKKRTENTQECESTGMSIESVCQTSKTIHITIANRNNLQITKVIFRFFDYRREPLLPTREKKVALDPDEQQQFILQKDGVVQYIEAIPVTSTGEYEVTCLNKIATMNEVQAVKISC